ncbi:MAG: FUSC family protein [Pseudomonadota bacterium]
MINDDLRNCFRFTRPRLRAGDFITALQYVIAGPIVYLADHHLFMAALEVEFSRLGTVWGVIAAVFVIHDSGKGSFKLAVSLLIGTVLAALITLAYLLMFSFSVIGLGLCLGVGALLCRAFGRRDSLIPTSIAISVIMITAGAPSDHETWFNPLLRLGNFLIGALCGTLVVALTSLLFRRHEVDVEGP